jgi:hypothetical protein
VTARRAEAETAACLIADRLGVTLSDARLIAARLDQAKPGRLAAIARTLPAAELAALAQEEARDG